MIPPGSQVSFAAIAKRTGLGEQITTRLLRHAMTMRVFQEPTPGVVAHTQASKVLANPITNGWLKIATEDIGPASHKVRPTRYQSL